MANEPADDEELAGVFSADRDDRGGKEPAPAETVDTGTPRDEAGRFAAKSQPEPDPVAQAQPEPDASQPDPNANRHVPLSELLSERKQRQEKERLLIEAEARAQAYREQLAQQPRQQPVQQPQQQQYEVPDPYTDPEGYVQYHLHQQAVAQRDQVLDAYEDSVRTKHGDAVVDAALQAARQTGVIQHLVNTRNPWKELMRWHKDATQRAEIGEDLEAYKKRIKEEAVAEALASLKAGGSGQQQPTRFPGTLATATATGSQGAALTDEAAMADVFGSSRRNRRQ